MKIKSIETLAISDIFFIVYQRSHDDRGYFTETLNINDITHFPSLNTLSQSKFVQYNESFSLKNVVRGLHFQWNPFMGKLVRTIHGHMVDLILDIRSESKTFGKGIMYDMPSSPLDENGKWLWIPPGFAHGNYFLKDTTIEYFCTGTYNPVCEIGINPFSSDIDWSLAQKKLYDKFQKMKSKCIISSKDRSGISLQKWSNNKNSELFIK